MILSTRQANRLDHLFKLEGRTGKKRSLRRIADDIDVPEQDVRVIRLVAKDKQFQLHVARPTVLALVRTLDPNPDKLDVVKYFNSLA